MGWADAAVGPERTARMIDGDHPYYTRIGRGKSGRWMFDCSCHYIASDEDWDVAASEFKEHVKSAHSKDWELPSKEEYLDGADS